MHAHGITGQKGNITIFTVIFVIVCIFMLLSLFDMCLVYIVREDTKMVSEAIALAIAQELLFFEYEGIEKLAEDIAMQNGMYLSEIIIEYDTVEVSLEKNINLAILDRIGMGNLKTVRSSSRASLWRKGRNPTPWTMPSNSIRLRLIMCSC